MGWRETYEKARGIRRDVDAEDVRQARLEYEGQTPGFNDIFSYRKGGNRYVMKSEPDIARKYREIKQTHRPWDEMYFR